MAKVIKNELFESFAIVGLTQKEYYTLMEIVKKDDNDEKASKVLCLSSSLQIADINPVLI